MKDKIVNPDRIVDSVFPGRYLPLIFLCVLFVILSIRDLKFGRQPQLFDVGLLAVLGAIATIGIFSTRFFRQIDVAGQLFLFVSFCIGRLLSMQVANQHALVIVAMVLLIVLAGFRGVSSLPLGASLPFIAAQIGIKDISLPLALVFPMLIAVSFGLLFVSKDKPALPPLASLAAAAIYLTRLSWDNEYRTIGFIIIGLCLIVIATIYVSRYLASRAVNNVNIHVAEDCLIYFLGLAAIRLTEALTPVQSYTLLAAYFFAMSFYYNARGQRAQFIAAGVVAIGALVPVLEEQLPPLDSLRSVVVKVLTYCMIGASAAAFSQLYQARLANHLGKVLVVYASFLLMRQISMQEGMRYLGSPGAVALALVLGAGVLTLGCVIGHLDLHRPGEKLWAGIFSPRLLAAMRRFGRTVGGQARSIPALGFFISVIGSALRMLRQAFGGRRYLALSHFSQIALVALAVPTFAICLQRAVELYFGIGRGAPPELMQKLGLGNGYPVIVWVFGAFVVGVAFFLVGEVLRIAYLRLMALLVPLAYVVAWLFAYSPKPFDLIDIGIALLAGLFVVAHVLGRALAPATIGGADTTAAAVRVSAVIAGCALLWILLFAGLSQPLGR
jgi:hypothetical protein